MAWPYCGAGSSSGIASKRCAARDAFTDCVQADRKTIHLTVTASSAGIARNLRCYSAPARGRHGTRQQKHRHDEPSWWPVVPVASRFDYFRLLLPTTVDPASTSPNLLSSFGEFTATMLRVGLSPIYRHFASSLFLRLLLLLVPRGHGFIVRPACVILGHLAHSFKRPSLQSANPPIRQSAQRVSFLNRRFQMLA